MNVRLLVKITGRVQGVSFRRHTAEKALEMGVRGWVRNLPDGSVQACLEGGESAVRALRVWFSDGPPLARIDSVHTVVEEYAGEFREFTIRFEAAEAA